MFVSLRQRQSRIAIGLAYTRTLCDGTASNVNHTCMDWRQVTTNADCRPAKKSNTLQVPRVYNNNKMPTNYSIKAVDLDIQYGNASVYLVPFNTFVASSQLNWPISVKTLSHRTIFPLFFSYFFLLFSFFFFEWAHNWQNFASQTAGRRENRCANCELNDVSRGTASMRLIRAANIYSCILYLR